MREMSPRPHEQCDVKTVDPLCHRGPAPCGPLEIRRGLAGGNPFRNPRGFSASGDLASLAEASPFSRTQKDPGRSSPRVEAFVELQSELKPLRLLGFNSWRRLGDEEEHHTDGADHSGHQERNQVHLVHVEEESRHVGPCETRQSPRGEEQSVV